MTSKDEPFEDAIESPNASASTSKLQVSDGAEAIDVVRFNAPSYDGNPRNWFIRLEAQFRSSRIKLDSSMFDIAIAHLPNHVLDSLSELVNNVTDERSYKILKAVVLEKHLPSETERLNKLFDKAPGNAKPSELYRIMKEQAGDLIPDSTKTKLWLQRLPKLVHTLCLQHEDRPISELVKLADKYSDIIADEVSTITSKPSEPEQSSSITAQLAEVTRRLDELSSDRSRHRSSSKNRGHSKSRQRRTPSRNKSPNRATNKNWCYYHNRFGDSARKCTTPCQFSNTKN